MSEESSINNENPKENKENISVNLRNDLFKKQDLNNKKPKENVPINQYIVHPPLKYGKKIYFSEIVAEQSIRLVAFISIAVIMAIFYYIFQESIYAFFTPEKVKTTNTNINPPLQIDNPQAGLKANNPNNNDLKQESYSLSDNNIKEDPNKNVNKPEEYTPDTPENNNQATITNKPEEYKPESYSLDDSKPEPQINKPEEYKPESYTPDTPTNNKDGNSKAESSNITKKEQATENINIQPVEPQPAQVVYAEEAKATIAGLVLPNDTIDGKKQYIWQPVSERPKYSLVPLAVGAFKVTVIGLLIAAPIAILAAIFTVGFAPRWLKEILKPSIEILAGFPSVVIGFFCLITLSSIVQQLFGTTYRLNSFIGGLGMAIAVIPIIYTVTEDALSAIPKLFTEASLALGASRWQTAWRVILPAATPGVFAAIILGFGRAFGETMIALMATGNAALVSADIFESVRTMSATIGSEMAEVDFQSTHYGILFLIGAILFIVTFSLNAIAEFWVRKKLLRKFQGN